MDLTSIIRNLYAEKEKLDRAISSLEEMQASGSTEALSSADRRRSPSTRRRKRKSMENAEREQVSKRMKAYWSKRRMGKDPQSSK
jgi:hypothetical protein